MSVPNKTIDTAIDMGTLPASISQNVEDAGGTWNVWYKYTAVAGDNVVSVFAYGDATIYTPGIDVFLGPPGSETTYLSFELGLDQHNQPIQVPMTPGTTYYFKVDTNDASASPANLTLTASRFSPASAPAGSLFINDDTPGYPLALLNPTTGVVRQFVQGIVAGEGGAILPDGTILLTEHFNSGKPTIYASDFSVVASAINFQTSTVNVNECGVSTNRLNAFYVGDGENGASGHARIGKISSTGTILNTWTLPAAHIKGLAPSPDESIVYLYGHPAVADSNIKQWSTAGSGSFGSDLVAAVAGYEPCRDLICFPDGTVLAGYIKSSPVDFFARLYDAAGATVRTYSGFTGLDINFIADARLFLALDDPNSFWAWTKQTVGLSQFTNIKVSDGSILTQFAVPYFEVGYSFQTPSATPSALFGHSESCPALVLTQDAPPVGGTATLIVTKIANVVDSTSFPFTTTGGLTPSTFSLLTAGTQNYPGLAAGTYGVTETTPTGWTTTYSVSNGDPHTAIVLAGGDTVTVTVTNTFAGPGPRVTYPIRRVRQSPHFSTDQLWQFFSNFQLDIEAGVGLTTGQGSDPVAMLSWSDDGGHTWSNERWLHFGKIGEYTKRAMLRGSIGRSRDRIWKVVISDPVPVRILQAMVMAEKGLS